MKKNRLTGLIMSGATAAMLSWLGMFASAAYAENGVTSTEITIGMCNVLTGPAAQQFELSVGPVVRF